MAAGDALLGRADLDEGVDEAGQLLDPALKVKAAEHTVAISFRFTYSSELGAQVVDPKQVVVRSLVSGSVGAAGRGGCASVGGEALVEDLDRLRVRALEDDEALLELVLERKERVRAQRGLGVVGAERLERRGARLSVDERRAQERERTLAGPL